LNLDSNKIATFISGLQNAFFPSKPDFMKKNIIIFLVIWFVQITRTYSQTQAIDSLRHLVQQEKQDSTRSLLLEELSHQYEQSNSDSALLLAQQGFTLARQIKFSVGEIKCLIRTGIIFSLTGNDSKALEFLLQALKRSEAINNKQLTGRILGNIGNVYLDLGDERKALEYNLKSREIAIALNDERRKLTCAINIGDCYEKLNQLNSARFFTRQAYELAVKKDDPTLIGIALNNLGNIYSKMHQPLIAMDNYRRSIPYLLQSNEENNICEPTLGMAKLFQLQKQNDSCLHYARLSYEIAQKDGFAKLVLNAGKFLADYYKQHRVVDSAYAYLSIVNEVKDSLYSMEKIREIQNLSFEETIRQQEIIVQNKIAEENHIRNLQLLAIGVFIPIFFLIVLFLSRIKVKARVVEFFGIVGLLMFFEFITDLIYPYVSNLTNDRPVWEMLILVIIAILLEPLNYKLEHWVKERLVHKPVLAPVSVIDANIPNDSD
jgi:tetratricopeptide (TPR) repeat protein